MRIDRDKLIFMGLVALDEVIEECRRRPCEPSFALRVVLATLHSLSEGPRAPFDDFWIGCQLPDYLGVSAEHIHNQRVQAVSGSFQAIMRALQIEPTVNFHSDLHAARRAPTPGGAAYSALKRKLQSPEDAARQCFAEALRLRGERSVE